jgi:hypothetical protein
MQLALTSMLVSTGIEQREMTVQRRQAAAKRITAGKS